MPKNGLTKPVSDALNRQNIIWLAQFSLGIFIMSLSYPLFLIENNIAPGGVSGVAMIVNHLAPKLRIGLMTFVFNIPLFIIGYRQRGRGFIIASFIAMAATSYLIDALRVNVLTNDLVLAAAGGGVVLGIGLGLIMRSNATSGGSDMAAMLLHKKFPILSVGAILMGLDCLVIIAAGIVFEPQAALYAMVTVIISTRVMDQVVEGFNTAKAFFIVSDNYAEITKAILEKLERGVTLLNSKGAYSRTEREVLLCVVTRTQIQAVKRIVYEIDPRAFMILTDAHEVLGEGFSKL